ncbi:hypothetical protein ABID29_002099 [Streptococcus rupicaprae]|uniref:Transcriptional regulator n=1 Tax=Streptococcus rupicaprae TaxID=759619 RepID=A0ABV2FK77_9STRE
MAILSFFTFYRGPIGLSRLKIIERLGQLSQPLYFSCKEMLLKEEKSRINKQLNYLMRSVH